jgi:SulP family sulfate permease
LPPGESLALFDLDLLRVLLPYAASSTLLCAITLALMVTGIEALSRHRMDVDHEMRVAGYANIVGGALGGLPTGHALSVTTLLVRTRAAGRWVSAVPGVVALAILLFGADVLALVPRPVLAALLLSVGIEWLLLRSWREARILPRHEVVILLVVASSIVFIGIVEGIAIGLGLALLIFAWTYRRIPVIRRMVRGHEMHSSVTRSASMMRVLEAEGRRILLLRLQGYMFFLNAETVHRVFTAATADGVRVLVLDFAHVLGIDSSASASRSPPSLMPCAIASRPTISSRRPPARTSPVPTRAWSTRRSCSWRSTASPCPRSGSAWRRNSPSSATSRTSSVGSRPLSSVLPSRLETP